MSGQLPFESIYRHGFVRLAVATPRVALADPRVNLERLIGLSRRAVAEGAVLVLFPELSLSGYSLEDLAPQDALLDEVERAVAELLEASERLPALLIAGAPLRAQGKLFNCALAMHRGVLLGVVPKTYLPNYREFYEKRQYSSASEALEDHVRIAGQLAPFGGDLVFHSTEIADLAVHVEICEDLWVPLPPSAYAALAGATVLLNLSASNATIAKADFRRLLCTAQSAKCVSAYAYSGAGYGESTTDLAWDGHAMVCENGELLAESPRFALHDGLITADVDLERLRQERMRLTSFNDCSRLHREQLLRLRRIAVPIAPATCAGALRRPVARFPYVPSDPVRLDERCAEIYSIQVQGLVRRLQACGLERLVLGVSGGLDSTHALLVAVAAMDMLGLPRANVLAYTLPGFATSARTHANAQALMRLLEVTCEEIDIRPAALQQLKDIGHPYARGAPVLDTTFENVQAGVRAAHLFRLANLHGALVVGTSDLSELALGYTTYGIGDQMSHYAVNASVPKTLIQHLIRWAAGRSALAAGLAEVLDDVLATRISPELVPGAAEPASAEAAVGPYELQDFNLYYLSRFGFRPSKVAFLACHAWSHRDAGAWPHAIPPAARHEYDLATIKHWLETFLERFFQSSQFKRSALPNGPKVGSGGSLSPRADWRAPSDVSAEVWLQELRRNVPVQQGD